MDHPPRAHDDVANAACGVLTLVALARKQFRTLVAAYPENTAQRARAYAESLQRGRIAPVTTGRDQADEYRRHLLRCQDPRSCDHHPAHGAPLPAAPASEPPSVIDNGAGTHWVSTPTGAREVYRDARGLGPEEREERCPTCGCGYPASRRAQHQAESPRCRPTDEFSAWRREGWTIAPDPNDPDRVVWQHGCGENGNTFRSNMPALHDRHMADQHGARPDLWTSG